MNQKLKLTQLLLAAAWLAFMTTARAQLNIPGADGSDGVLETPPAAATLTIVMIDLAQAATGKWDDNNSANAGKGVYDPEKWAVVFKYSSVNIRTNTVIKFKNHPSRAPVVWLVTGDVLVAGEINLNGNEPEGLRPAEPGPGGFRGGTAGGGGLAAGSGFGPGGGVNIERVGASAGGAYAFTVNKDVNVVAYGNTQIVPLLGGSGTWSNAALYGGAGGGAILIAARQLITVHGRIIALGGPSRWQLASGGAIRLVANQIAGRGEVNVAAGINSGRLRLETQTYSGDLQIFPPTLVVAPENPPLLWSKENAATARIVSVTGKNAPSDPSANLEASGADITMQDDQPVDVVIETRNLNIDTAKVGLRISPRNGPAQVVPAVFSAGTSAQATWVANTRIPQGFAALQVRAVGQ